MIASEETTTESAARVSEGTSVHHCPECGQPVVAAPHLENAESGTVINLRCFVRHAFGGQYIAECIDLDISAEAETEEAAIAGLQDAMVGYLAVVFDGDGQKQSRFILRPSPLSHWILYYVEQTKYKLRVSLSVLFQGHPDKKRFYKVSPFTDCQVV